MAIPKPKPSDWIKANAEELAVTDRQVLAMLRDSKKRVDDILASLPAGSNGIQRAQLENSRAKLLAEQAKVFERLGDIVSARRASSASRSARLSAAADNALLSLVGKGAQGQFLYDSALQVSQRAIDAALQRMKFSQLPLSSRIYNTSVWMNGRLGKLINETLASGLNAKEFAKQARDWFNPNTPGGVRYAAMRLARTEINNAFHSMSAQKYAETPWIEKVVWNLSGSHPIPDECDAYAKASPYDSKEVPARPHPQCMCYITAEPIDESDFIENFLNGDYDAYIDKKLEEEGWTETAPPESAKPSVKQKAVKQEKEAAKKTASEYVPDIGTGTAGGNLQQRVQYMLHQGKTRQEIVNAQVRRGQTEAGTNKWIDEMLIRYDVPNHVMPRTGSGFGNPPAKTPNASAVIRKLPTPVTATRKEPVKAPAKAAPKPAVKATVNPELEDKNKSKIRLDLEKGIDPAFPQEMARKIKRVIGIQEDVVGEHIGRVKGFQHGLDAGDNRPNSGLFQRSDKVIRLQKRLLDNERQVLAIHRSGEATHCGHDGGEGIVAHEMGHAFLMRQDMSPKQLDTLVRGLTDIFKLPHKVARAGKVAAIYEVRGWELEPRNKAVIEKKVSRYATTNLNEMLAEIWADYTMNPNPSPDIKKAGDLMKSIIKTLPKH